MRVKVRVRLSAKCASSLPKRAEHGVQSRRCFEDRVLEGQGDVRDGFGVVVSAGVKVRVSVRVKGRVRVKVRLPVKCASSLPRHAEHGVQSRRCLGSGAGGLSF